MDTDRPTDSAVPGDTGDTGATDEPEICQECVVWAAANGESYEVTASTLPTDCDGDGLSNTLEASYAYVDADGAAVYTNSCLADTDKDGILDGAERDCLNPTLADTDGDGVNDGDELAAGTDACVAICLDCVEEAAAAGRPFSAYTAEDCDGDGITNEGESEATMPSDPCLADTDGDGLLDAEESGCEDPQKKDSDGDGLNDDQERLLGSSSCLTDSDGDGLPDGEETADTMGTWDADNDGLTDDEVVRTYGTDPVDADTDDDCFPDRYEVVEAMAEPMVSSYEHTGTSYLSGIVYFIPGMGM